jgi:hypothetical protein
MSTKGDRMSNFYKTNKKIIDNETHSCTIAKPVERIGYDVIIENEKAKNGSMTAKISQNQKPFIYMHSKFRPEYEAEEMLKTVSFKSVGMYFVFGLGLGYQLTELSKRCKEKSVIIVIEPFMEVFENMIHKINMSDFLNNGNLYFMVGFNDLLLNQILNTFIYKHFLDHMTNVQYIELSYYKSLVGDINKKIEMIKEITTYAWRALGNCQYDHNIGFVQSILNTPFIVEKNGINEFEKIYKDKDVVKRCIVVSAGPSLNDNLKLINENQNRFIIIALDATLNILVENGITPDFIVTMERVGVYENFFDGKNVTVPKESVLVCPSVTQPEVVNYFKDNKIIFFYQNVGIQEYLDNITQKGKLSSATSAAYTAINVAITLGFIEIVLIGQDLSYSEKGDIYADGMSSNAQKIEKKRKEQNTYTSKVINNNGVMVESNIIWAKQRMTIETLVQSARHVKFYNTSLHGAKIEGTVVKSLKDYVMENCCDDRNKINIILERNEVEKDSINVIKNMYKKLTEDRVLFKKIYKKLKIQNEKIDELLEKENEEMPFNKVYEIFEENNKLTLDIMSNIFLKHLYQMSIRTLRKEINELHGLTGDELVKVSVSIHKKHFVLIYKTFLFNMNVFNECILYLNKKIENINYKSSTNQILKSALKASNINEDYADNYYKSITGELYEERNDKDI